MLNSLLIFFLLNLYSTRVEIIGRELFVNNSSFTIKGVCYSPTPVGSSVDEGYSWWEDENTYKNDFPMIKSLGANTIRSFDSTKATKSALDEAQKNNLYIIMGYWVKPGEDFSNTSIRNNLKTNFLNIISQWKNHPSILMWSFGNEVYPGGAGTDAQKWYSWYSLVNEVAKAAKEIDPDHLLTTVNADVWTIGVEEYGSDDKTMSSLDCWSVNLYLGLDFKDRFARFSSTSTKPLLISEFGADAYDSVNNIENQTKQAEYIKSQWKDIEKNLTAFGGVCIGGSVFEWSDEWWKHSNKSQHDTSISWNNENYYDVGMNEEWFGITAISAGSYTKTPRTAYYTLKQLWTKSEVEKETEETETTSITIFKSQPKNFPNPVKYSTPTKIKFELYQDADVNIQIYDYFENEISNLNVSKTKDKYEAVWTPDNKLQSGIYIAKITAKTLDKEETKFVKILLIK